MTAVQTRTITTIAREYVINNPATIGDIADAIAFASRDYGNVKDCSPRDDSIMIRATEDEIILWFEEEAATKETRDA